MPGPRPKNNKWIHLLRLDIRSLLMMQKTVDCLTLAVALAMFFAAIFVLYRELENTRLIDVVGTGWLPQQARRRVHYREWYRKHAACRWPRLPLRAQAHTRRIGSYRAEPQIASLVGQWCRASLKMLDLDWSLLRHFNYRGRS